MADDVLGNIEKKFDLGKTTAQSAVNQTLLIGLFKLLIGKKLLTLPEVSELISQASEEMEKRMEFAESLPLTQTAGNRMDTDKQKRRIRKEYKILQKRFEAEK